MINVQCPHASLSLLTYIKYFICMNDLIKILHQHPTQLMGSQMFKWFSIISQTTELKHGTQNIYKQ